MKMLDANYQKFVTKPVLPGANLFLQLVIIPATIGMFVAITAFLFLLTE